jgi:hypothetical protein
MKAVVDSHHQGGNPQIIISLEEKNEINLGYA